MTAPNSRATSALPQPLKAAVTDYLVGTQLDEAIAAGQDVIISWPFAKGDVVDWTQAEAIWYVQKPSQLHRMNDGCSLKEVHTLQSTTTAARPK